ncbi:hypothetical protein LTR66_002120 [Elasticomyces elasticus]|nr:hypothetical protein LTR50_001517 [Elasticomyces elasticus]KAK4998691.1 hypothetical protein LTR66_002120 [Elasticomyces elasticus]
MGGSLNHDPPSSPPTRPASAEVESYDEAPRSVKSTSRLLGKRTAKTSPPSSPSPAKKQSIIVTADDKQNALTTELPSSASIGAIMNSTATQWVQTNGGSTLTSASGFEETSHPFGIAEGGYTARCAPRQRGSYYGPVAGPIATATAASVLMSDSSVVDSIDGAIAFTAAQAMSYDRTQAEATAKTAATPVEAHDVLTAKAAYVADTGNLNDNVWERADHTANGHALSGTQPDDATLQDREDHTMADASDEVANIDYEQMAADQLLSEAGFHFSADDSTGPTAEEGREFVGQQQQLSSVNDQPDDSANAQPLSEATARTQPCIADGGTALRGVGARTSSTVELDAEVGAPANTLTQPASEGYLDHNTVEATEHDTEMSDVGTSGANEDLATRVSHAHVLEDDFPVAGAELNGPNVARSQAPSPPNSIIELSTPAKAAGETVTVTIDTPTHRDETREVPIDLGESDDFSSPTILEKPPKDIHINFHKKAKSLKPNNNLPEHRYWIGVLNHDLDAKDAKGTKDFIWFKANRIRQSTTIRTVRNMYQNVTITDIQLIFRNERVKDEDCMEELDYYRDHTVIFRAYDMIKHKRKMQEEKAGFVAAPLITNATNDVVVLDDD